MISLEYNGGMRVLIVEDEKDLAAIIKKGLSEAGYVVDVAHDGEEGLLRCRQLSSCRPVL